MNIFKNFILYLLNLLRNHVHQPKILDYLLKLDIKNAFDIGAHEGETLEYFLKIESIKKIHSFEPQILIYNKLFNKYNSNNKIVLNNLALSNNIKDKVFSLMRYRAHLHLVF